MIHDTIGQKPDQLGNFFDLKSGTYRSLKQELFLTVRLLSIKIRHKTSIHYIPADLGALPNAMTQEIERGNIRSEYKRQN